MGNICVKSGCPLQIYAGLVTKNILHKQKLVQYFGISERSVRDGYIHVYKGEDTGGHK